MHHCRLMAIRDKKAAKLPAVREVIRGTLKRYYLTCGNHGCRCHRSKEYHHGPYWYVCVSYKGGGQKRYLIHRGQLQQVRQGVLAYERLWQGLCQISDINLKLVKLKRDEEVTDAKSAKTRK